MPRLYTNSFEEFKKDFDCPNCGIEIEVETGEIDLNEEEKFCTKCPNCKASMIIDIFLDVNYKPTLLKDV